MKVLALATTVLLVACAAYGVVISTERTPPYNYRILVTQGRVVAKTIMLEGRTSTVPAIEIVQAMNPEGKMMNSLQNRVLTVVGPLTDEVLALQGHQVVVRGIVRKGGVFQVTWIQDKKDASQNINAPTPVW